ncbi:uncharacterized protein APUU_31597A [Aspergillus puulaauensis]|uniref:Uncharacterized protein n=1 Tax=Aspergillus puulaauensis TaxID=1220207 RepID=A0A7R7XLG1_9EURO|nr:uncharacterized protein APUU_31597A [Aspergillus puulaauensis]BCS23372.1 hypothetical protein APUU_31597A [Aspergillus puulaauensis]
MPAITIPLAGQSPTIPCPKPKKYSTRPDSPPRKGPKCFLYWEQLKFPIPDVHYHTELRYDKIPPEGTLSLQGGSLGREPGGIYLYKMSRIFLPRFFPDPPIGAPPRNDSYYTLANRAGESSYPVKKVIAARYVEAIVLLSLRDLR